MAAQPFSTIASKSTDATFTRRLAIAITEHCRFTLGQAQGERSADRFAWDNALARTVLVQVSHEQHLQRFARLCLLPADWDTFDPDDDADLQVRAAERFTFFAFDSPPA